MSDVFKNQSGSNVIAENELGHVLLVFGTSVPADTAPGYATGCLFIKTNGGAGTALYCNEGTAASADFDAVSVA